MVLRFLRHQHLHPPQRPVEVEVAEAERVAPAVVAGPREQHPQAREQRPRMGAGGQLQDAERVVLAVQAVVVMAEAQLRLQLLPPRHRHLSLLSICG